MKLEAVVRSLPAQVVHPGARLDAEIQTVYAGDKMSDLLEHATSNTLIVTNLINTQLLRVGELMDLPGICLVDGAEPGTEILEAAAGTETALIVSPFGLFETCGRLYALMNRKQSRSGEA